MKKGNTENLSKRGKKGGTMFPRYSLENLNAHLNSFVSKTHTNPISIEQLNAGVFGVGSQSIAGKIKYSALKQFGLLDGEYKKIKATELASKISMAEGDERIKYFQEALSKVPAFVNALNTFQNSKAEKSKIGQYAVSSLKVHPDMKEDFVNILIESAQIAGLCTVEGNVASFSKVSMHIEKEEVDEEVNNVEEEIENGSGNEAIQSNGAFSNSDPYTNNTTKKHGQVSNINVNIDVDPSMDPEKLEKLLKLLKNYGAI